MYLSPPSPTTPAPTSVSQYACCWKKIKINIKDGPEREKEASKASTYHRSTGKRRAEDGTKRELVMEAWGSLLLDFGWIPEGQLP